MNGRADRLLLYAGLAVMAVGVLWALWPREDKVEQARSAVVKVVAYDIKGRITGEGMGFFFAPARVLTSRHLLYGADSVEIRTNRGKTYSVTGVVAQNRLADIVSLAVKVPHGAENHVKMTRSRPRAGMPLVAVCGDRAELDLRVAQVFEIDGFGRVAELSKTLPPLCTGAPAVDPDGRVGGVIVSRVVDGQKLTFLIPSEHVFALKEAEARPISEVVSADGPEWPDTAEGRYAKGFTLVLGGEYGKALRRFDEALERDPDYLSAWLRSGWCSFNLDQPSEALRRFKEAIRTQPDSAPAYEGLGEAYGELRRFKDAARALEKATTLDPDYTSAYLRLGWVYWKLELQDKAIQSCRAAARLDPGDEYPHLMLGWLAHERGKDRQAEVELKRALEINPDFADAYHTLGLIHSKRKQYGQAADDLEKAAQLDPKDWEIHDLLGLAYYDLERYADAVEAHERALRIKPGARSARYGLGLAYTRLEQYEKAVGAFKTIIRVEPNDKDTRYSLGFALCEWGRPKAAAEQFKTLIRIKPDYSGAHYMLGICYYDMGRYREALDAQKQAIALKPDDPHAHYEAAITHLKLHDIVSATKEYRILQKLDVNLAARLQKHLGGPSGFEPW